MDNREIIAVKNCDSCPLENHDEGEGWCGVDHTVDFFCNEKWDLFPPKCPLLAGKVFVICKFMSGKEIAEILNVKDGK